MDVWTRYKEYPYMLVEFLEGNRQIEAVLTIWTFYERSTKSVQAFFPAPPYTNELKAKLKRMLKQKRPFSVEWDASNIKLLACANSYTQALSKLQLLRKRAYAFTPVDDEDEELSYEIEKIQQAREKWEDATSSYGTINDEHSYTQTHIKSASATADDEVENSEEEELISQKVIKKQRPKRKWENEDSGTVNVELPDIKVNKIRKYEKKTTQQNRIKAHEPSSILPDDDPLLSVHVREGQEVNSTNASTEKTDNTTQFLSRMATNITLELNAAGVEKMTQDCVKSILQGVNGIVEYHVANMRTELCQDLVDIKNLMKTGTPNIENCGNLKHFCNKYNLSMPFSSKDEFEIFNDKLKNSVFLNDFILSLSSLYGSNRTLTKNLTCIIRSILTRDVALTYTAKKKVRDKDVFSLCRFAQCISDFIRTNSDGLGTLPWQIKFDRALSTVLTNSKDWDGMRKKKCKYEA